MDKIEQKINMCLANAWEPKTQKFLTGLQIYYRQWAKLSKKQATVLERIYYETKAQLRRDNVIKKKFDL